MAVIVWKVCRNCGDQFSYERGVKGKRTVTCSDECGAAMVKRQHSAHEKKARSDGRYRNRERRREQEIIGERSCVICGAEFPVRKANPGTQACSVACGNTLATRRAIASGKHHGFERIWFDKQSKVHHMNVTRRQRKRDGAIPGERVEAPDIFARDKWLCGLCHRKVDKRLKWPHKMSASLDHITPLAEGGAHAAYNLQCAHLLCNWLKQDGPGGQMRLF